MSETTREQLEAQLVSLRSQNAAQAGEILLLAPRLARVKMERGWGRTEVKGMERDGRECIRVVGSTDIPGL
jgi:hypothetical protein